MLAAKDPTMSDTDSAGRSSKKKSFSSRFSSKMDKLSNPFKKGDTSDSDDSDSESQSGKSKSLFGGKLHNPFKKGHSSDSDDDSHGKSPAKSRKSSSSGKPPAVVPPMPSNFTISPNKPDPKTDPVEAGLARGEAQAAVAAPALIPSSKPPAVAPPGTAAGPAAPALPARTAPAPAPAKAPAGTTDAALPAQPAGAPAAAASAGATAAGAAGAAPAPAPEPKKPRVTVGGPVFGAPEILLTGVKGDPDEVMKTLRTRGFVVHLVREMASSWEGLLRLSVGAGWWHCSWLGV